MTSEFYHQFSGRISGRFRINHFLTWQISMFSLCMFFVCSCREEHKTTEFQGYLEGDFVYISCPFGAKLKKLTVKKGEKVKAGALLFELDKFEKDNQLKLYKSIFKGTEYLLADMKKGKRPSELQSCQGAIDCWQALFEGSGIGFERASRLWKKDAISFKYYNMVKYLNRAFKGNLERAKAELETAKLGDRPDRISAVMAGAVAINSKIANAEWELNQMAQHAPKNALVFDTIYQEGEYVPSGKPVVMLLPQDNVKCKFFVPDNYINKIKLGQKIFIILSGKDKKISATVNYISPKVEYTPPVIFSRDCASKLVYMMEAAIKSKEALNINLGQPVTVSLGN